MAETFQAEKAELRRQMKEIVGRILPQERERQSELACELLSRQPAWKQARSVLFYAPLPGEVDVWPLFAAASKEGKLSALPRFDPVGERYEACDVKDAVSEVQNGRFGIREPVESCPMVELNRLDIILVPGVAFDLHGRRLGRGKGFYDRLLSSVRGITCGVAFDAQIVRSVPVEPHDVHLNCILTATRWIEP